MPSDVAMASLPGGQTQALPLSLQPRSESWVQELLNPSARPAPQCHPSTPGVQGGVGVGVRGLQESSGPGWGREPRGALADWALFSL